MREVIQRSARARPGHVFLCVKGDGPDSWHPGKPGVQAGLLPGTQLHEPKEGLLCVGGVGVGGSPRPRLASWSPPPSLLGAWPRLCLALPAHGCAPAPAHLAVPRHLMSGARDPLFAGLSCVPLWMTHSTLAECPKNCTDSVAGDRTGSCLDPSLSVSPDPTPNYQALGIQLLLEVITSLHPHCQPCRFQVPPGLTCNHPSRGP